MIDGFDFYKAYLATKLHFTTSYDAVKYCGKTAYKAEDFGVRNDRFMFDKWAKRVKNKTEAIELSIANFIGSNPQWVHEDVETGISIYTKWKGIQASLTYKISEDYRYIANILEAKSLTYDNILQKTPSGNKAPLLQLLLTERILPDTIVSLDTINGPFMKKWLKEYIDDPLVAKTMFKVIKYKSFTRPDYAKLTPVFNDTLSNQGESRGKD